MDAGLRVDDLTVHYGHVAALRNVTFEAPPHTTVAVIGPNGSGKSTLLRAIAGILEPSSGTISPPPGPRPAFVLQSTDVDRSLPITVRDVVSVARYPSVGLVRRFSRVDREAVERAMDRLSIADLAERQVHDLSGGQRQRVMVAQGLAQEAPMLLLDEPVTGLDVVSRSTILEVVDQQRESGQIVLLSTHGLDDARRCDRVLLLDGAPVAYGAPPEVLCEEHLRVAFGGRFMRLGDSLVLDDPHHTPHG